jgi:2-polyprenyl-3-methyl-5-hydroxy-6-metoxy-1,4-benzoquinol methylase
MASIMIVNMKLWSEANLSAYHHSADAPHTNAYLMPEVSTLMLRLQPKRIFELGCGNGDSARLLARAGYCITGVDPSERGIAIARALGLPNCQFEIGSAYDNLASRYGQFDVVLSLEVVEHVFYPRLYAKTIRDLLNDGGTAIVSTPYHGYVKNLATSILGKWDYHMNPLWDYGHIKLWSRRTLRELFSEVGLKETAFHRVGRIPQLAKSMIATYKRTNAVTTT